MKECEEIPLSDRMKDEDDLPYSNAVRVESKLIGKECYNFGLIVSQKAMKYCCYTVGGDSS